MIEVSIVCCYNDEQIYKNVLIKSLEQQKNQNFEIVAVNNSAKKFKSCASALNYAVSMTHCEKIIAVHQDFEFTSIDDIDDILTYMNKLGEYDICGAAGAVIDNEASILQKLIGRNRRNITSFDSDYNFINNKSGVSVETLDECCICFKRKLWKEHHFSEELCFAWDLYAVEMCLYASVFWDGNIKVIPIKAIHHSAGNLTDNFYLTLHKILLFYKGKKNVIITTCVVAKTNHPTLTIKWLNLVNFVRKNIHKVKDFKL